MIDTRELRVKRKILLEQSRAVQNKADEEKRSLSAEESGECRKILAASEVVREEIEAAEVRNDQERLEHHQVTKLKEEEDEERKKEAGEEETTSLHPFKSDEYHRALVATLEGRDGPDEQRALSAGTATEGGFLYASEQFQNELIQNVTDATIVRQLARTFQLPTADSMGTPVLTDRMSAAEWTSELGPATRDTSLAFGKRALTPHPLAKEIPISKTLIRKVPGSVSIAREELARVVAEANENGFLTGNGAQQPLGMFTVAAEGITTSRDVSTGNTATSPTFDGLKNAKYTLKQAYWGAASWIMHRDVMLTIALLKDGNGRYLLQDSVVQGEPDRILQFPVHLSEFAPNTLTASQYVAILGDYSNYWIVDSMATQISVLQELLARSNQDLFIIRMETDGQPVREEAFVRVQLSA